MKVNENLVDEYNERQKAVVEFTKKNLEDLLIGLNGLSQEMVRIYANFSAFPSPITILNQEDFDEVEMLCIEIQARIDVLKTYGIDIGSDVNDFYKPYDYKEQKKAIVEENLDLNLRKFVDEEVDSVEVSEDSFEGKKYGHIIDAKAEELRKRFNPAIDISTIKLFKKI